MNYYIAALHNSCPYKIKTFPSFYIYIPNDNEFKYTLCQRLLNGLHYPSCRPFVQESSNKKLQEKF